MSIISIVALCLSYLLCAVIGIAFAIRLGPEGIEDEPALALLIGICWPMMIVIAVFLAVATATVRAATYIEFLTRRQRP